MGAYRDISLDLDRRPATGRRETAEANPVVVTARPGVALIKSSEAPEFTCGAWRLRYGARANEIEIHVASGSRNGLAVTTTTADARDLIRALAMAADLRVTIDAPRPEEGQVW